MYPNFISCSIYSSKKKAVKILNVFFLSNKDEHVWIFYMQHKLEHSLINQQLLRMVLA